MRINSWVGIFTSPWYYSVWKERKRRGAVGGKMGQMGENIGRGERRTLVVAVGVFLADKKKGGEEKERNVQ